MSTILTLLLTVVPLIPKWIAAGEATVDLYTKVQKVIDENRKPSEPEWDELEAMIAKDQATVRDKSRDT